jgi:hypothetical protein
VRVSGSGRIGEARGSPTVGAGIVSAAGVQIETRRSATAQPTPDDHLTAGPRCRVKGPARGCVGGARGRPTIRAGIVSPAGI